MKSIALVIAMTLFAAAPIVAQEIKPASQEDVLVLAKKVTDLQTLVAELQKKNEELQARVASMQTTLNNQTTQINNLSVGLGSVRTDNKAVYDMLGTWKTALETKNGGHFLWGLQRSSGQLVPYGGWGSY